MGVKADDVLTKEQEYRSMLKLNNDGIKARLEKLAAVAGQAGSVLLNFKWFFERERTIYATLNMFRVDGTWFKGICWCPLSQKEEVDEAITEMRRSKKAVCLNLVAIPNETLSPPTHFRRNEFLGTFQRLVEAYGVPSYQECNPALFAVVTFPFLFGVMFGDLAHGTFLLALGMYLCARKEWLKTGGGALSSLVDARYLVLLMGLFSAFAGFIYNDFASVPLTFGPSCYGAHNVSMHQFNRTNASCVYPWGMDPRWHTAQNHLQFDNSFKMKLSVIIGALHMLLGIVLKGTNCVHFGKIAEFFLEFLPQLVFMGVLSGYLITVIVLKWATDWTSVHQRAPSLISQVLRIALPSTDLGPVPLYGTLQFQDTVHFSILCIAGGAFVFMLVIKPAVMCIVSRIRDDPEAHRFSFKDLDQENVCTNVISHRRNNKLRISEISRCYDPPRAMSLRTYMRSVSRSLSRPSSSRWG